MREQNFASAIHLNSQCKYILYLYIPEMMSGMETQILTDHRPAFKESKVQWKERQT